MNKEIKKGNLVRFQLEGENKYGSVLSIYGGSYKIEYQTQQGTMKVIPLKLEDLILIGRNLKSS
jgi:hypothetical protein